MDVVAQSAQPLLGWDLRYHREDDAVVLDGLTRDFELRLDSSAPEQLMRFLSLLDGSRSTSRAAEEAELSETAAAALVGSLFEHGVAVDVGAGRPADLSPADFVAACRRMYPPLKHRLFSHPLWTALTQGRARRGLFMGWLIENYHFIDGVNDRLALAAAACTDARIRPFFVKHYIEEWDHSAFFLKSLASFGIPRKVATETRPLPSTVAALNHMRRCARRDPLEYAACSGFLESTGEDREKAHRFFAKLTEHYAADKPQAVKPLADHAHLDEAYQHNTVVEDICAQIDRIPVARASAALGAAVLLVETLEMWSSDILRSYDSDELVPRIGLQGHRPGMVAR
jgi:pyrroloquinoline quinone (PQQ) biosynthesis protein C